MSSEFYEWLDECPVNWVRESHDPTNIEYNPFAIVVNEAVYRFMEDIN
tara:strand:- start:736 stop:879 length:144 start_codon:yes stop_codon:yes gene_type:complete